MRIVAFRVATESAPELFGYGLNHYEAAKHLASKLGRNPALAELRFQPIVVEPEPQSLLITPTTRSTGFFVRS